MRKLIAAVLALSLLLFAASALADTAITVTGSADTLIPADTAVVSLGVSIRDKDALQAQSRANEVIAAIRDALTGSGIAGEDINTGYINLYAVYDYSSSDIERITAYNASSTLAVRVTDMDRVGQVIDLAFSAGANTLDGVVFSASDTSEAREASLKAAFADARAKAEILADAAGLKITGVTSLDESSVYSYESSENYFRAKDAGAGEQAAGAPTVVQAAKICVTAGVTLTCSAAEP